MMIPVKHIPEDTLTQYALHVLVFNYHVLVKIRKDMYGLFQAEPLAQKQLYVHLLKSGYANVNIHQDCIRVLHVELHLH